MKPVTDSDSDELYQPMLDMITRAEEGLLNIPGLPANKEAGIRTLRKGLHTSELKRGTFTVLSLMRTEYTVAVVDDLVYRAVTIKDAPSVKRVLGRLSHREASEVVPPAVWRVIEVEEAKPDEEVYDVWYRMAELLGYLGLFDALTGLLEKSRDHIDDTVRELHEYYEDSLRSR